METDKSLTEENSSMKASCLLLQLLLFAVSSFAALGVMLTCFASPEHNLPVIIVAVSCGLAIIFGLAGFSAFPHPVPGVFFPPVTILMGAIIGITTIGNELQGNLILMFGNLLILSGWQVLLRFIIAFIAIGILGVFNTIQSFARGLSAFAISGPGLLLLYYARAKIIIQWPQAETWQVQGIVIVTSICLLIMWGIFLSKAQILEKIQDALGRIIIHNMGDLKNPKAINKDIYFIDAWIDPLCYVKTIIHTLIDARTVIERQGAISKLFDTPRWRSSIIPWRYRERLEKLCTDKPEILIVLAEDDFLHQQPEYAMKRLKKIPEAILSSPQHSWIADQMRTTYSSKISGTSDLGEVLHNCYAAKLVTEFADQVKDRHEALQHTINELNKLAKPLPESCRKKLASTAAKRAEAIILLAEDDFISKKPDEGFVRLAELIDEIAPEVDWLVADTFAAWDRHSKTADRQVQSSLWNCMKTLKTNNNPAFLALTMIALEQGLSVEIV